MGKIVRVFEGIIFYAVFIDKRWYDVSYEYGKPLLWGRYLGCDFVETSCKQWIDTKREQ